MKTSSLKFFLFIYFSSFVGYSQIKEKLQTKISEYYKELKTYDFNDPNPIPILLSNPKIYGINIACVEGVKPFEIKDVPVNDGENHPLDQKK